VPDKPTITPHVRKNIESIAQFEQELQKPRTPADRLSAAVCGFAGTARFLSAHAALFAFWLASNHFLPERLRFDPTLTYLQVWAGLEALFLSGFVLMNQNRQGRLVEHWSHVSLQIGLLTEQEMTKVLQLQQKICDYLGLRQTASDPQLAQMVKPTDVEALVAEVGKARAADEELIAEMEGAVRAKEERVAETAPKGEER